MVEAVRKGRSQREVARANHVSLSVLQRWIRRAGTKRLDRVDFSSQSSRPHTVPTKTSAAMEEKILDLRKELRQESDLGDYGAEAIHEELLRDPLVAKLNGGKIPSVRTINRILERRGVFDRHRRIRRPAPRPGWYLPEVVSAKAELDSADFVEGLFIKDKGEVMILNLVSMHGGLVNSWPRIGSWQAAQVIECLLEHWREVGLPTYVQFDNDLRFHGPHHRRDSISRVMRMALSLGVTPVFAPPGEQGFQNDIESYNGRWQAKVWARFVHDSLSDLENVSRRFVLAVRHHRRHRISAAPQRRAFPTNWKLDLQQHPKGRIIFLRRLTDRGTTVVLGRTWEVDPTWPHRLVRCEVDLNNHAISFYRLRRSQPEDQPLLKRYPYRLPERRFKE